MNEKLLTAKEIAVKLEVKPITVRVWLKKGLFPNAKLENNPPFGEVWRVPESDLENFQRPEIGRPIKKKEK